MAKFGLQIRRGTHLTPHTPSRHVRGTSLNPLLPDARFRIEFAARLYDRLLAAADSTGQRNTFAELLSGRSEAKRLAWPPVQLSGNGIELKL